MILCIDEKTFPNAGVDPGLSKRGAGGGTCLGRPICIIGGCQWEVDPPSLKPRLPIPDFVPQLWRKVGKAVRQTLLSKDIASPQAVALGELPS